MSSWTGMAGVLFLLMASSLRAEDIRTWVDADGTVHFGDKATAPKDSKAVELSPGSVVTVKPAPATPMQTLPPTPSAPQTASRPRHCTPVMEDYTEPRTGMHSQRDTGRCEEDGDVVPNYDYPYYYWGPCNGPNCARPPRPDPPLPPRPSHLPSRPNMGGFPLVPYR